MASTVNKRLRPLPKPRSRILAGRLRAELCFFRTEGQSIMPQPDDPVKLPAPGRRVDWLAIGTQATGAIAVGALAAGAIAIGALAIGRLVVGRARIRRLEIEELVVGQLKFKGDDDSQNAP